MGLLFFQLLFLEYVDENVEFKIKFDSRLKHLRTKYKVVENTYLQFD